MTLYCSGTCLQRWFRASQMLNRPMHEDALERPGLGHTDGPVHQRVLQRQQRRTQQGQMREVRMIIGKGAELDHDGMLPQSNRRCQNQKSPLGTGDSSNVDSALTRFRARYTQVFLSDSSHFLWLENLVAGGRNRRNLPSLRCRV